MTACGRLCCKTIFTTKLSNIDSRTGRGAQDRFKTSLLGRTDVAMRASPRIGHLAKARRCRTRLNGRKRMGAIL
jgi:hypothetical protein